MYLAILLLSLYIIGLNGQIFNTDSIPLTVGANIPTSSIAYTMTSLQMKTGKTELVMTRSGLKLLYDGATVWSPYDYSSVNPENPTMLFKPDGNLCIGESPDATVSTWCTDYYNLGGAYLNLLPDGSYGRQWAIVIQDANGQMVWGRFGPAISIRGFLPLIPGNFIDRISSSNNKLSSSGRKCINNGKDYLCVNSRPTDIMSFYIPLVKSNFSSVPQWKINAPTQGNYEVIFQNDTNFCSTLNGVAKWCNGLKQRYLIVPIAYNYENFLYEGTWATLEENMQPVYGRVWGFSQGIDKGANQLTFPTSGFSNDLISMTFTNGVIKYFNKIENKDIATINPPNSIAAQSYGSRFISKSFYFYKSISTSYACNIYNQACHSTIHRFEKPRITGAMTKWDTNKNSRWFCLSRFLPEVTLLDEDGLIIASSNNFNNTLYQYN